MDGSRCLLMKCVCVCVWTLRVVVEWLQVQSCMSLCRVMCLAFSQKQIHIGCYESEVVINSYWCHWQLFKKNNNNFFLALMFELHDFELSSCQICCSRCLFIQSLLKYSYYFCNIHYGQCVEYANSINNKISHYIYWNVQHTY